MRWEYSRAHVKEVPGRKSSAKISQVSTLTAQASSKRPVIHLTPSAFYNSIDSPLYRIRALLSNLR